jgi:hypothetical protein
MKRVEDCSVIIPGAAKSVYQAEPEAGMEAVRLLKGMNLDQDGGISTTDMDEVYMSLSGRAERYMLKEGDVVLMARGSAMRVSLVDKGVAEKHIIASANFLIIRPKLDLIKPEVIVAYLNSPMGQAAMRALSTGAAIQHIPTSKLRSLEVPVPALTEQGQIAQVFHASKEAYKATLALAEQQKKAASASMINLMMGAGS